MIRLDKKTLLVPVYELEDKAEELSNDGWNGGAFDNEYQGQYFYKD